MPIARAVSDRRRHSDTSLRSRTKKKRLGRPGLDPTPTRTPTQRMGLSFIYPNPTRKQAVTQPNPSGSVKAPNDLLHDIVWIVKSTIDHRSFRCESGPRQRRGPPAPRQPVELVPMVHGAPKGYLSMPLRWGVASGSSGGKARARSSRYNLRFSGQPQSSHGRQKERKGGGGSAHSSTRGFAVIHTRLAPVNGHIFLFLGKSTRKSSLNCTNEH